MFILVVLLYSFFPLTILGKEPLITYKLPVPNSLKELLLYQEDAILNFTQIVTKYGYNVEEHYITTEDGYILTTYRMSGANCSTVNSKNKSKKKNNKKNKTKNLPVILMHGVFTDAYTYIDAGPNASLAYLLSDSCYDVWVANARGTPGGRAHKTLDPDKDASFYHYSIDEIGLYDVPAIIDYVLDVTGSEKANYIGWSQGGGSLAITLSERPEYNDKVNLFIGLAPALRIKTTRSPVVRLNMLVFYLLEDVLKTIGVQEVMFRGSLVQVLLELVCHDMTLTKPLCLAVVTIIDSFHQGSIADYGMEMAYAHLFAGGSVQQFAKYHQWIMSGNFSKYDYGAKKNLEVYGTEWAPLYNISNVQVPSVVFTSEGDNMVVSEDVTWSAEQLPNLLELVWVSDKKWNHADYVYSQRIPTLLYPKLNEYLSAYSKT